MRKMLCAAAALLLMMTAVTSGCGEKQDHNGTSTASVTERQTAVPTTAPSTGASASDMTAADDDNTPTDSPSEGNTSAPFTGVKADALYREGFSDSNGLLQYSVDGKPASETGIDVSSYCGDIDWAQVKNAGVDFAMIRLGGRGYGTEGSLYADDRALDYIKGAQAAGVKTGGYFFSQAVTPEEAAEEVTYIMELLGECRLDYPIAYDWEIIKEEEARTDGLSPAQATACAVAFCEAVKSNGYTPMIYATGSELRAKYDLSKLEGYPIWYSEYAEMPVCDDPFAMWQYSKTGSVTGIEGPVDLDIRFLL